MTMRTSGRPVSRVPARWSAALVVTSMFIVSALVLYSSQVARRAQPLERVLGFVIHRAAGPLRRVGGFELGDDGVDRGGVRGDRECDVLVAERAVALAVAREIERD